MELLRPNTKQSSPPKQATCPFKLFAKEKKCEAFRKSEVHTVRNENEALGNSKKKTDVEWSLMRSNRNV